MHQIAPFYKNFLGEQAPKPGNTIQKGALFPNFKRSSSIHKNNSALVASIV